MDDLANTMITAAVTIITPVLLFLLRRAFAYLDASTQLKLSERQRRDLESALDAAIHYAEEEARRRLLSDQPPIQSDGKKQLARVKARSFAPDKLHTVTDDALGDMIDARLNSIRPSMGPPGREGTRMFSLNELAEHVRTHHEG